MSTEETNAKRAMNGEEPSAVPAVTLPLTSTKQSAPIFSTGSAVSNGAGTLRRIEFEFNGDSYKFALNPEEYLQVEPNRANVTQTKAGGWVDDFGGGIPTINFRGTTGFKNGTSDANKGFAKFKELRDLLRQYYFKQSPGTEVTSDLELIFHNYTDGEHWIVSPKQFSLMKSVARPLMYMYEVQLLCLRPATTPAAKDNVLTPFINQLTDKTTDGSSNYMKTNTTFVESAVDPNLAGTLKTPALNLSSLVGDNDGLVPNNQSNQVTGYLQVISPGIVTLGEDATLDKSYAYPVTDFNPNISSKAYEAYQGMVSSDPTIVDTTSTSTTVYSPLLSLSKSQPLVIQVMVNAIYLEMVALYTQVLNATQDTGFSDITKLDLQNVSANIRWVSTKLEEQSSRPYDLIAVLRDAQIVVEYLISQPGLFGSTYRAKLHEFEQLLSGGDE